MIAIKHLILYMSFTDYVACIQVDVTMIAHFVEIIAISILSMRIRSPYFRNGAMNTLRNRKSR